MKEKKIVGINTHFSSVTTEKFPSFSQISFDKDVSLYDYDVILINSNINFSNSSVQRIKFENGLCLSSDAVYNYNTIFESIKNQLIDLLKLGKNIYVILNQFETYYYTDLDVRYDFDIMGYLPVKVGYEVRCGKEYDFIKKEPYCSFFQSFKDYISYKNIINCDFLENIITIKGTDKCIGGICDVLQGKIIFIPALAQPSIELQILNSIKQEPSYQEKRDEIFLKAIQDLELKLSTNTDESLPDWTNSFQILNEQEILQNIDGINRQVELLQKELEKKQEELASVQSFKFLLTSSGKTLENIVKRTLTEIGFTLCEAEENRSDIIAKYKDLDIVAEIKGLTKSAGEKNSAQLEKWSSEFMEKNGKEPKSILIVNAYCDLPLSERKEAIFPNQMLKYAEKKEQCLLSTYQLLNLLVDIKEHPENSENLIMELLETVGIYNKYQ